MAKTSYSAPAVHNAIRLVELLAESTQPLGVSEICRALELNNNMVFRLLKTLEQDQWIRVHPPGPKYSLGLRPFHYLSKSIDRIEIKAASRTHFEKLWRETGESCYLAIVDGQRTLFLDHLDSTRAVKITARPGERFLMHCAAPGKALLAFSDESLVDKIITEGLPAQSHTTITDPDQLKAELASIRNCGYSIDKEEYGAGIVCFAVPVFDFQGELAGAIGISVLKLDYSVEDMVKTLGPKVISCGESVSRDMGFSGVYLASEKIN